MYGCHYKEQATLSGPPRTHSGPGKIFLGPWSRVGQQKIFTLNQKDWQIMLLLRKTNHSNIVRPWAPFWVSHGNFYWLTPSPLLPSTGHCSWKCFGTWCHVSDSDSVWLHIAQHGLQAFDEIKFEVLQHPTCSPDNSSSWRYFMLRVSESVVHRQTFFKWQSSERSGARLFEGTGQRLLFLQAHRLVDPVHCKGGQLCRKIVWFVVIIVYEEHLSFGYWIELIVLNLLILKCLQLKLKYSLVRHICVSAKSTYYLRHVHLTARVSVAPIGQIAMEFDTASVAPDTNCRNLRVIHHTFSWNLNFIDKTPTYQLITTCGLIWKCVKKIQIWLKLGKNIRHLKWRAS